MSPEEYNVVSALAKALLHDSLKEKHRSDDEWERAGEIIRNACKGAAQDVLAHLRGQRFDVVAAERIEDLEADLKRRHADAVDRYEALAEIARCQNPEGQWAVAIARRALGKETGTTDVRSANEVKP